MSQLQFKLIGPGMKCPGITFPAESQIAYDKSHRPSWRIQTCKGEVEILATSRAFVCRGSMEALMAAGLLREEWMPGAPGNNTTRQSILFTADGAQLIIGNRKSRALPGQCLTVIRAAKTRYEVEITLSEEDEETIKALRANANEEEESQASYAESINFERDPQAFADARGDAASEEIDGLLRYLKPCDGVAYSEVSASRIVRQLAELRRAFHEARSVRIVPKYQQRGNVVCWPGRGSVAPVTLNA